jgi:hypothetical protein
MPCVNGLAVAREVVDEHPEALGEVLAAEAEPEVEVSVVVHGRRK